MSDNRIAKINKFQEKCLYRLLNIIHSYNEKITVFNVHIGKEENWIELSSIPSTAKYWIYEDSSEIILGIIDGTFEWQAYENDLDALTDAFISEVGKRLKDFES